MFGYLSISCDHAFSDMFDSSKTNFFEEQSAKFEKKRFVRHYIIFFSLRISIDNLIYAKQNRRQQKIAWEVFHARIGPGLRTQTVANITVTSNKHFRQQANNRKASCRMHWIRLYAYLYCEIDYFWSVRLSQFPI